MAAKTDRFDLTSLYNKAVCSLNEENVEACATTLKTLIEIDGQNIHGLLLLAACFSNEGMAAEANSVYQAALATVDHFSADPRNIPSHMRRAFTKDALAAIQVDIHHHMAIHNFNSDDAHAAMVSLDEGLTIDPQNVELRYLMGVCHALQGNHILASGDFGDVINACPDHAGAHHGLALTHFSQFKYDATVASLGTALECATRAGLDCTSIISDRALTYREMGAMNKAASDFRLLKEVETPDAATPVPRLAADTVTLVEASVGGVISANERRRRLFRKEHGHELPSWVGATAVPFVAASPLHPSRFALALSPQLMYGLTISRQKAHVPSSPSSRSLAGSPGPSMMRSPSDMF